MICEACRERRHEDCPGPGFCYCQHRPAKPTEPATGTPSE